LFLGLKEFFDVSTQYGLLAADPVQESGSLLAIGDLKCPCEEASQERFRLIHACFRAD
jgi:hypothetical protein